MLEGSVLLWKPVSPGPATRPAAAAPSAAVPPWSAGR